jgi:hypothetical protein
MSTIKRKATTAVSTSGNALKRSRYAATIEDDPEERIGPLSSGTLSGLPPGPQPVAKDTSSDSLATLVTIIISFLHATLIIFLRYEARRTTFIYSLNRFPLMTKVNHNRSINISSVSMASGRHIPSLRT